MEKPIPEKYNKSVSILKKKIVVWGNLDFTVKRTQKNIEYGNVYKAKYLYKHPNGQSYLSLYDAQNNWIGYFNKKDVINV